jgi:putative hydrolase of the HAD superfamily
MIRALLLDLDNTLVDRDAAVQSWLSDLGCATDELVQLDGGGYRSKPAWFAAIAEATGLPLRDVHARFFRDFPALFRLRPDADALLSAWSGPTVIVTNGTSEVQRAKIAAAGLSSRVTSIVISGEVGVEKPDPAVFRLALERAGVGSDEACMVGDHPRNDVAGARNAGLSAVFVKSRWFDPPPDVPAVDDLGEILAWSAA